MPTTVGFENLKIPHFIKKKFDFLGNCDIEESTVRLGRLEKDSGTLKLN
jgi:hypothetical protein